MDAGRRTSTVRQLELLVEFAEANRDLALGRLRSKEARALSTRLWRECANNLNSEGPARLPKQWAKVWNDMKSRVRGKLTALNLSQRGTGGGPHTNVSLTSIEERVAEIIGRDVGPIANVAQDPFIQAPEENQAVVVELVDIQQPEANEAIDEGLQLNLAGPSRQSPPRPIPSPSQAARDTPPPQPLAPPSLPPSQSSTPSRRRLRPRQRPYQRARVHPQGQTSRGALDESRAMVLRIEELRARTDSMLAQAALKQAEAAKAQADAAVITAESNRLQAQTMATMCESLCSLVPAVRLYLESHASMVSSSEEEN